MKTDPWLKLARYWSRGKWVETSDIYLGPTFEYGLCPACVNLNLHEQLTTIQKVVRPMGYMAPCTEDGALTRIRFCLKRAKLQSRKGLRAVQTLDEMRRWLRGAKTRG